jgi:hypothetical protein
VGQCLWEVADEPLPARVVLLGKEADVVSERDQPGRERVERELSWWSPRVTSLFEVTDMSM